MVTVFKLVWLKRKPVLPEKNKEDPTELRFKTLEKKLLEMEKNETKQNQALAKQESIIKNLNERLSEVESNPTKETSQEMIVEDVELDIAQ